MAPSPSPPDDNLPTFPNSTAQRVVLATRQHPLCPHWVWPQPTWYHTAGYKDPKRFNLSLWAGGQSSSLPHRGLCLYSTSRQLTSSPEDLRVGAQEASLPQPPAYLGRSREKGHTSAKCGKSMELR